MQPREIRRTERQAVGPASDQLIVEIVKRINEVARVVELVKLSVATFTSVARDNFNDDEDKTEND